MVAKCLSSKVQADSLSLTGMLAGYAVLSVSRLTHLAHSSLTAKGQSWASSVRRSKSMTDDHLA
jgi:hypothetical protein